MESMLEKITLYDIPGKRSIYRLHYVSASKQDVVQFFYLIDIL